MRSFLVPVSPLVNGSEALCDLQALLSGERGETEKLQRETRTSKEREDCARPLP